MANNSLQEELVRCCRVADQMVTCHSILRDNYYRKALTLDVTVLVLSAWMTATAFVDPAIAAYLAIGSLSPTVTIGVVATTTFCLSLFQLKADWKQRCDRHAEAARVYTRTKFALGRAMDQAVASELEQKESLAKYYSIGDQHIAIPDAKFNQLKQRHLLKIAISKAISNNPGAPRLLIWFKIRLIDSVNLWRGDDR